MTLVCFPKTWRPFFFFEDFPLFLDDDFTKVEPIVPKEETEDPDPLDVPLFDLYFCPKAVPEKTNINVKTRGISTPFKLTVL